MAFLVIRRQDTRTRVSTGVWAPDNLVGCQAAIAIAISGKGGFDAGRVAQNVMLAAWNDGVGTVPNGIKDAEHVSQVLELPENQSVATIISLGYPERPAAPPSDPEGILQRIDRKSFEELVTWVD